MRTSGAGAELLNDLDAPIAIDGGRPVVADGQPQLQIIDFSAQQGP